MIGLVLAASFGAVGLGVSLHGGKDKPAAEPEIKKAVAVVVAAPVSQPAAVKKAIPVVEAKAPPPPAPVPAITAKQTPPPAPVPAITAKLAPPPAPVVPVSLPLPPTPAPPVAKPAAPRLVQATIPFRKPKVAPPASPTLTDLAITTLAEVHPLKSIEVSLLASSFGDESSDGYEPFKGRLGDALRSYTARQAVPLPMIYQAVLLHDNDWLRQLLKDGFAADEPTPLNDTALCAAINSGNLEAVDLLLLYGADPNLAGRERQPPLALASLKRGRTILPALLRAGADANCTFARPVPDALIESVPFPELKTSLRSDVGVTPLIAASARGDSESVIELLSYGARTNKCTTKYYRYPINYAAEQEFIFIMRILLGRAPDSEPDVLVTVDLSEQRAYLRKNGEIIDKTSVSTGREGYDTPAGRYLVTDKHEDWTSTIYKCAMPFFMRLNCSSIGLHSGYVTGEPASHGCVRLPYSKAQKWFGIVKVGDEVQIVR